MDANTQKSSTKSKKQNSKKNTEQPEIPLPTNDVLLSEPFKDYVSKESLEEIRSHLIKSLSKEDVINFQKLYKELYEKLRKKDVELPPEVKLLCLIISDVSLYPDDKTSNTNEPNEEKSNSNTNANTNVD